MFKMILGLILATNMLLACEVEDSIQELLDLKTLSLEEMQDTNSCLSLCEHVFSKRKKALNYSKVLKEIKPCLKNANLTRSEYLQTKKICTHLDCLQKDEARAIAVNELNPKRWFGIFLILRGACRIVKKDLRRGIIDVVEGARILTLGDDDRRSLESSA